MTGDLGRVVGRAHPFTLPALTGVVTVLAFLLPGPFGPPILYLAVLVGSLAVGERSAVLHGLLICLPLWFFLVVLHGVMGSGPSVDVGPLQLSRAGAELALAQAGRLGAIITATLVMYQGFRPARFIDAAAARGWPFHLSYLLVATIMAVPRLVALGRTIREAQRARGLRVRGGVGVRLRGLNALALPLLFGALAEVEDRTLALETRGVRGATRRTPLDPPRDSRTDRVVRWGGLLAVVGVAVWRVFG